MVTSCCQDVGVGPVSAVAAVQYSGSPPLLACRPILTPQLPAPPGGAWVCGPSQR